MDIGNFVQNIKFHCERKGVKPTVACREAGVGGSFINNIEARGSVPSVEKVEMLAHYLGVTVSELIGEVASSAPVSELGTIPPEVVQAYAAATPELQAAVRRVLGVE